MVVETRGPERSGFRKKSRVVIVVKKKTRNLFESRQ